MYFRRFGLAVVLLALVVSAAVAGTKWIAFDGTRATQDLAVYVTTNTAQSLSFSVHIPTVRIQEITAEDEVWQQLDFKRASIHARPGEPQVPVVTRWIAVPQGADVRIKVDAGKYKELEGINHFPAQIPPVDCYTGDDDPGFSCGPVYERDAFFPGAFYSTEGPTSVRGMRLLRLDLFPVQVNPVTEVARIYSTLNVDVSFTGGQGRFFTDRRANGFQKIYDIAMNRMAFRDEPAPALTGKSPTGAEYLMIVPPTWTDAIAPLAEWKTLQGYDTEVYTTDDSGTTCESVKAFMQNAYDTWDPAPEFVLFVGDAEFINPCYEVYDYGEYIGSDLHFCQLEGDDEWPECASGRISVDTAAELEDRVADILMYERNPLSGAAYDDYYSTAVNAAYFQPGWSSSSEAERRFCRTSEEIYQWFNYAMVDSPFDAYRLFFTDSSADPMYWNQATYNWTPDWWAGLGYDDYNIPPELLRTNGFAWDAGATDIAAMVNAGAAFVTHRDHGGVDGWSEPAFSNSDVQALANGDKLVALWSINCLTGYFDNETGSGSHAMAFTEEWERHPNGGAVGILASTRVSYSGRNDRMVWGWMDSHFPEYEPNWPETKVPNDPEWRMGLVLTYGKLYMDHYYQDDPYRLAGITEFHWFGDPTMEMWAGVPGTMTVSHLPIIPMGAASFSVDVNVDGALVALVQDGIILGKAISSAGTAEIAFDGPITVVEDVNITVTRRQYRPYEETVMVGATDDGVVNLNRAMYTEDDTIEVSVSDAGLIGLGTYSLHIDSDSETGGEDILCTELVIGDGPTGSFFGSIEVTTAPATANGVLSIGDGDTVTLYYHDDDTGSGSPADKTDTAYADTAAPTFAGAVSAVGSDHRMTITWHAATDLTPPITYQIYRAETSGGQVFTTPLAETGDTQFVDTGLPNLVEYFYVVRATDSLGHQDTNTAEVSDYTVGPVTIWEEDFDPDGIPASWEIIDGGNTGPNLRWNTENFGGRTSDMFDGLFAIADSDETGSGPDWDDYMITEAINCSGYSGIRLLMTHYYHSLTGDQATLYISTDGGDTWEEVVDYTGSSREQAEDIDVSEWADGQSDVRFSFYYAGDYDWWWGVDNLELIGQVDDAPPIIEDFAASTVAGPAPLTVNFDATTSGQVSSCEWDFGDGNLSYEMAPTHVYDEVDTFAVTLTIENPYGADTLTKNAYIEVSCPAPVVDFEADVTEGETPLEVSFTDLSDAYEGCDPTSIAWDFGDGTTVPDVNNPSHTYDAPGTYTVSLTYTTEYGDGEFVEEKVDYIDVVCGLPVVDFEADVTEGEAPLTVQFTDLSDVATGCEIDSWTWGYGVDQASLTTVQEQNPEITFEEPGVYHIALRVTNEAGADNELKASYITVTEAGSDDDATDDDDDDDNDDDASDDDAADDDAVDDDDNNDDDDSGGCGS
ncbi:MAG: C25 family cysteine peptidase [Candidatus Lernaella stagnicola]|nr:C25 family cysteine peptidase [Candidatus Lernaella stagnicola]